MASFDLFALSMPVCGHAPAALLVLIGCIAFLHSQSAWSNAVRFVNALLACIVALNYYEPVADLLEKYMPTYTYCLDFLALWAVFCVAMVVFRTITDYVSRVDVRFIKMFDLSIARAFAALIGIVMMLFTMISLHMAPLGETFLFGYMAPSEATNVTLSETVPLGLESYISTAAFAPLTDSGPSFPEPEEFIEKYRLRRKALEEHLKKTGAIRTPN